MAKLPVRDIPIGPLPSEIEAVKRLNFFELGLDDTMSLTEYLLSDKSEADLKKYSYAGGGMASMDDMTRPVGYENGGNVTRRLSSTRAKKPFEDFLRDIGFTKKDEKTGKLRGAKGDWAKYLTSKNIKVGSAEATDELNNLLKAAGKPTYIDIKTAGKNFSEDIISAITGTEPGERGARDIRNATNSKIVEIKKVATQAEGANSTKAKQKLLTTLFEKSFPVLKTVPKYAALLSTAVASKAFGYIPIATEMGDAELPKEPMIDKKKIDFSGPSANAQLLEQMSQDAAMNKRGGGMMNMDEMIRPLGYEVGGIVPKPKPKPRIVPKEKPIDFDALMAEFNKPENKAGPGAPTGIEKIIADQFTIDPRFTMKQKIKKMLGIGGDQGSSLMDDVEDLKTLLMKSEILDNKIGKVAPMSVFMELDNMSPKELMDAYIEYGGSKFR